MDIISAIGDTARNRAALIWCHGSGGTRADVGKKYSKLGYVVIPIDYRITPGNFTEVEQLWAATDLAAAIRYVTENAVRLRINPALIFTDGVSAGAVTCIHENIFQANHDDPYFLSSGVNRSNHGYPFKPAASLSISGAANTKFQGLIKVGISPQIFESGTKDVTVDYKQQVLTFNLMKAVQPACTQKSYDAGHKIGNQDSIIADVVPKFFAIIQSQTTTPVAVSSATAPIINAIAFTPDGMKERTDMGKAAQTYIFRSNYKIDGSDWVIRDNLSRVLNLLQGGSDEPDEDYLYSYINKKDGANSGYFDSYPDEEVQRDLDGFKAWFTSVVNLWIADNNLDLMRVKDELKQKYFLKINCTWQPLSLAQATTTVASKVSCLIYTQSGAEAQMKKTPHVDSIQKNWWLIHKGYQTNGDLAEAIEGIQDLMNDILAGKSFVKNSDYPYQYGTPDGTTVGTYLEVPDSNKSIVPQLELDFHIAVGNLISQPMYSKVFSFGTDTRDGTFQGFKLYQQIIINRK
jgi:hypothetical protein